MARRKFTPEYKLKVAIEALSEQRSLPDLAKKYKLAPAQISTWKRELTTKGAQVFVKSTKTKLPDPQKREDQLLRMIGELQVENSFLKKRCYEPQFSSAPTIGKIRP
jgi:transposase